MSTLIGGTIVPSANLLLDDLVSFGAGRLNKGLRVACGEALVLTDDAEPKVVKGDAGGVAVFCAAVSIAGVRGPRVELGAVSAGTTALSSVVFTLGFSALSAAEFRREVDETRLGDGAADGAAEDNSDFSIVGDNLSLPSTPPPLIFLTGVDGPFDARRSFGS
jgi:hypothetical protein